MRSQLKEVHAAAEEAAFYAVEAADGVDDLKKRVDDVEKALLELPNATQAQGKKTRQLVRVALRAMKSAIDDFDDDDDAEELSPDLPSSPSSSPVQSKQLFSMAKERVLPDSASPVVAEEDEKQGKFLAVVWWLSFLTMS